MIFDIKPMVFPPGNVGGEFVCKVLVASLLSKLDAGAPYNGWILGGGLWFDSEKEAEKIPMGFNSEKSFAKMNKDGNVANGVRAEVMELKPVIVKEATEERTRGEGQTPFGKMVKCDDFINIFHGKGSRNEGHQLTRFLSWSNPSETSLLRSLREHLLWVHSSVGGCASFFFPSFSDFLGAISGSARHKLLGGCGERGGEIWGIGISSGG
jgi:hypothetical protein